MSEDGLLDLFAGLFIAALLAVIVLFGWAMLVGVPEQAAEKAVCYERGGVYVILARDAGNARLDPGCYQPLVPVAGRGGTHE